MPCKQLLPSWDGQGRVDGNHGSTLVAPNSFGEWAEQPQFKTLV